MYSLCIFLDCDISHLLGLQHSPPNMRLSPEKIGADSLLFAVLDGHGGTRLREPQWPRHAAGIHNGNDNVNMIYIYICMYIIYTYNYLQLYRIVCTHLNSPPRYVLYIYTYNGLEMRNNPLKKTYL